MCVHVGGSIMCECRGGAGLLGSDARVLNVFWMARRRAQIEFPHISFYWYTCTKYHTIHTYTRSFTLWLSGHGVRIVMIAIFMCVPRPHRPPSEQYSTRRASGANSARAVLPLFRDVYVCESNR